jgi:hypothetical protein
MRSFVLWISVLVVAAGSAGLVRSAEGQMTPKEESEAVMNAGIPFAQKMLAEHAEFYPFGFAMTAKNKVVAVAPPAPSEHPAPQQLIDALAAAFRAGASSREYKATAVFVDVRVQPPDKAEKTDAVQVGLEHVSGYCVDVFFPYSRDASGRVTFGAVFASKRAGAVFGTCK